MPSFQTRIHVQASPATVWQVLADLGSIDAWNPGVEASHATGDQAEGVGAKRHCQLRGGYLDEEVTAWEPGRKLTLEVVDTNLPLARAEPSFELSPGDPGTDVVLTQTYEMRWGLLGRLMDKLFVSRKLEAGMEDLLKGLKAHCEALDPEADAAVSA